MDTEKIRRRQSLKVIISEAVMVLAVVVTVSILALIVSGYWVNSDFKVERNGMLQVSSVPTGADVDIDGEKSSWLQRTNTSKVLASGEHTITLTKNGYDSWSKAISVSEGLLYRLHYPRLFLLEREPETVLSTTGTAFATVSPDGERLLLTGDTTEWSLIDLSHDSPTAEKLDISGYFPGTSLAENAKIGVFSGKILSADWDRSGSHVLFSVEADGATEWVLLDVENVKNSLNLTKEFGASFSAVEILDNSSSKLVAVQHGNLRKIDIPGKAISAVMVPDVIDFDHYENEIIFSAKADPSAEPSDTSDDASSSDAGTDVAVGNYMVGLLKIGDEEPTKLTNTAAPAKVAISKFYDDMYISILQDSQMVLYQKEPFAEKASYDLGFAPQVLKVGHNGEFITMRSDSQIATLDMEINAVREWQMDGSTFGWLDNDMIYTVSGGELIVYDFDGLNRRALAKNVSSHFPATITANKWLYYFSDGSLIREKIVE